MTREEQIIEAGKIAAEGKEFSVLVNRQHRTMSAYEIGFIEGAQWADFQPNWISVEDELPPFTHPEGASVKNTSDYVLVYNGYMVYISRLVGGEIKWWEDNSDVHPTHWMPLPQLPKKGG